jgi:glycosyltransferase involved in cell wall biosynthesis
MRIVMLAPHPAVHNGLRKCVPLLAAALRAAGCEVFLEPWGRRREGESAYRKLAERAADIRRIRHLVRSERADVLVVHTAHDWPALSRDIPLLLAARTTGCRAVVHFHGSRCDRLVSPGHLPLKLASRWLLRFAAAILVLSSEERRAWAAFAPAACVYEVTNPFVASSRFAAPARAQPVSDRSDRPVVLFVGRLVEEKGASALIDILPQTPCALVLAGEGPLEAELMRRAARAGVADRVTLTGYLEGDALRAAFDRADLFALPTRWPEGFPLAIVEAMDAGLPIITTRIRGAADHLTDGIHALFVPPGDGNALAQAIVRLVNDQKLRAHMSEANRAKAGQFAPDRVARQYLAALQDVLQRNAPARGPARAA